MKDFLKRKKILCG